MAHSSFARCAAFFLLAVLLGPAPARAQNSSTYTIRRTVRRVVLDIVVTDAQHHAVRGLTPRDFSVFEDSQPQQIRSFDEADFDPASRFTPPHLAPLPPGMYMDAATVAERGPLYAIVYDAVHMRQEDQPQARKQLADFLASKPSGTRFALFLLAGNFRLLQGFTTDASQLLAAFDPHRKEGHIPQVFLMGLNAGATDTDLPFEIMSIVGHYLEGLPGRKNLIWFSSEFPMSAGLVLPGLQANTVGNAMAPAPGSPLQAQGFDGVTSTPVDNSRSQRIMKQAIDALNAAQVSVYPVNVGGLKPELAGIDPVADRIATVTGGRAYYNTNDFRGALEDATENGASYYEISYAPANAREDGKMRRIRVSLDREGLQLAYRRYYYAEDPDAPLTPNEKKAALAVADEPVAHRAGDSMYAYMQHGAPADHDVIFRAEIHAGPAAMATPQQMAALVDQPAYFVVRRKNKPAKPPVPIPLRTYTVDYLVLDQDAEKAGGAGGSAVLEFAAGAYDSSGKLLNGISQNAMRDPAAGHGKPQPIFRAEQTLDVPTSAAWLRIGVRDVNTDRIGTLELPLPLSTDQAAAAR